MSLVILLHGVGGHGGELAPLGQAWSAVLPGTGFAAPDGPFPFDQGGTGRQWFSISGVTADNRPARVAAARPAFDALIGGLLAAHGLADRPDRVALVGFSQGAAMALDAAASGRWPVAAVVAFAARLATPEPLAPSPATRVLLVHGEDDQVIPVAENEVAESRLAQAGFAVARHVEPGLGHGISPRGAALAGRFLADALGAPSQPAAATPGIAPDSSV